MADRGTNASTLLLDEFFGSGDGRFLGELLACRVPNKLKNLAGPLYADPRPFAREAVLAYVDDGCDRRGHRPFVKALFKLAELREDDELMGRFLVAFDRLARRRLVERRRWDPITRGVVAEQVLRRERSIPAGLSKATSAGRFSIRTRRYLARRAFRYFRRLGYRDVERYGRAIRAALVRYEDAALDRPERLLDAWGLMHALYGASPVLDRASNGIRVATGRQLAELEPAPLHPSAWRGCFDELLRMLGEARSRTVRQFTAALLTRAYARDLAQLSARGAGSLLASPHEEAQALGALALSTAPDLDRLSIEEWLELLTIQNVDALSVVCEMAERHIPADRLSLAECVSLAKAPLAPVAALGLRLVREREIRDESDLSLVLELRDARVAGVRAEAAEWLAGLVRDLPFARAEHARDLVDAAYDDVRAEGLELLHAGGRFTRDLGLAAALSESPYHDVRAWLVARLGEWERDVEPGTLRQLWATAMLSIHRGNRVKIVVLDQISDRLAARPDEAELLLPILGVALRSVRPAERRVALAAVARAARRAPAIVEAAGRLLPELRLGAAGEAAR